DIEKPSVVPGCGDEPDMICFAPRYCHGSGGPPATLKGHFSRGLGSLGEGFRLIRQPGLRLFVIIPLVINVLLFGLLFYFIAELFSLMIAGAMAWLPDWAWLQALDWLFWILYGVVIVLMLAYGFVIIANLIGSPFYGYLAELTEKHLTGQEVSTDGSWAAIIK